jgi:hypothetical protein
MWRPKTGSKKPQCFQCKSTSKQEAREEEIEAFMRGETISPFFIPGEHSGEEDEEPEDDQGLDDLDIEALINDDSGEEDEEPEDDEEPEKKGSGLILVVVCIIVLVGGGLAGAFFLSRKRNKGNIERISQQEQVIYGSGF